MSRLKVLFMVFANGNFPVSSGGFSEIEVTTS